MDILIISYFAYIAKKPDINSQTGIIQPVIEIGEVLSNTDIFFYIDATQSFGKLNDELRQVKYDMLSFTAHKFGAP